MSTKRIDIVFKQNRWIAEGRKHREVASDDSKAQLVERMAKKARAGTGKGRTTSLRIHKKNGHLQEERSYRPNAGTSRTKS